jgi:hypothetical protein
MREGEKRCVRGAWVGERRSLEIIHTVGTVRQSLCSYTVLYHQLTDYQPTHYTRLGPDQSLLPIVTTVNPHSLLPDCLTVCLTGSLAACLAV